MMKKHEMIFFRVDKEIHCDYVISAKELKSLLKISGEIKSIELWEGRSPNDIEQGICADSDKYVIRTLEKRGDM